MRRYGGGMLYAALPLHMQKAVSGFEPMTNKSPRHNFTTAPGLALNPEMGDWKKNLDAANEAFMLNLMFE